jgi:CHASE2 domain-containing sensor protein
MASTASVPTLFISYRREDAGGRAGRLCDWFKHQFGAARVFLDTETIASGDDFVRVLEARLAGADVLVAVIGPDWLDCANARGRRLDQPDDFVRLEVATALARGKRVVPVLVGGAPMPAEADLPEPLKPLHRCNAIQVDDASFERDFNALVDDILQRPRGYLRREVDRLTRLVRAIERTSLLVPGLALAAVMALWVGLLAPLNLESMSHNGLLWAADALDPLPDDPGVVVVAIDDDSERTLGPPPFGASAHWRALHARLIERAHGAGARAVVFDLSLSSVTDADARLAAAARAALADTSPTRVVFGTRRLDGGQPALTRALRELPWGTTCLRRRGQTYAAPLAVLAPADRLESLVPVARPALALTAAVDGSVREADLDHRRLRVDQLSSREAPRFSTIARVTSELCGTLAAGDDAAFLLIRPSAADYWPRHRISYAQALEGPAAVDTRLRGRIVLVGDTRSQSADRHPLRRGLSTRTVPGVELHAEAIATLLNRRETILPTVDAALALLAGSALAGAATGFFATALPRWPRRALMAGLGLAYLGAAVALATHGWLLNLPYDLTAFLLAWFVLHRLQADHRKPPGESP